MGRIRNGIQAARGGFTLLELLVVMAIVAILSAIAVPQYAEYKARAFDVRARSDLVSVAIAQEAYFLDAERYLSCSGPACEVLPGIARISEGVELAISATETGFSGTAAHPKGSGAVFTWQSSLGGLVP